jgi:hypothetical protein
MDEVRPPAVGTVEERAGVVVAELTGVSPAVGTTVVTAGAKVVVAGMTVVGADADVAAPVVVDVVVGAAAVVVVAAGATVVV